MQINALPRQLASAGAIGALALGALAFAPAAQAAAATTAYTCGIPNLAGPYDVSVVTDLPGLPTTVNAGLDVPADLLPITNRVTVPKAARDTLAGLGYTTVSMPDFAVAVGVAETVVANAPGVATSAFAASADGTTYTADINGKNVAFNAPAAGTHTVSAPAKFTILAAKPDGSEFVIPCDLKVGTAAGAIATVTTTANESTVTAKARKVATGQNAKVKVKVAADNEIPTGKIIAKIGSKQVAKGLLDAKGKVVLKIKAKFLEVGKNKVKLKYNGDDYTAKSKSKVFVKVIL